MSFGGPSKTCPRCNTVLPAQATFCGTCGLQFSAQAAPGAAPASNYGPGQAPYPGQGAPGVAPQGQPGFPPQSQPNYPPPGFAPQGQPGFPPQNQPNYPPQGQPSFPPPGQPGYAGYPGAPGMPPPTRKGGAGRVIVLLLVLVILVGGAGAAWYFFLGPGHSSSSSPFFDRHGLQSNVPLPNNTSFSGLKKTFTSTDNTITVSFDVWGWQVSGTNAVTVQQFYKDNLSKNGWTRVNLSNGSNGEKDVTACQGGQLLSVSASDKNISGKEQNGTVDTIAAPSGGSALSTALSSSPALVQLLCSNSPIFPTP